MNEFEIKYLADIPQHIQACAAWSFGRWGVQRKGANLENNLRIFKSSAQKNQIPLTLVAINKKTKLPIGMGSLWDQDGDEWPDKTPWIASIYTLYRYRGLGVATALVQNLERQAKKLGFLEVYLQSGSAAGFYANKGYESLEVIKTSCTTAGTATLFVKNLSK